jgi:hypothetical protein
MEAVHSSETVGSFYGTIQRHMPEDSTLHRCDNFKYNISTSYFTQKKVF